ncbi:tyrosine-protein phosphatase [Gordonia sp. ABSL1-1]|uniref:tyrosine-protein phosphatase n=1 Tax=Gordonia sp. ABSL1-1 TaxID=3053923 RepID=UPI0025735877|nr:tyrosine-protein phosphatase [Gordonia sp. ABSL1-1]MDL9936336.1 tyrosine-protein phosphatase [Gordonia sp. ABSL1-1]
MRLSARSRASRTIAAGVAAAALIATPALVVPSIAPSATAAPTSTVLDEIALTGTENTRTFLGYRTADGHLVNQLVIRSDNLSKLTPADQRTLQRRDVRRVIDLRTALERTIQPNRAVPGAQLVNADILGGLPPTALVDMPGTYRAFVTDPQARRGFRTALLDIKSTTAAGHTALFHCTAGKDRTGWTAAVLLTVLGVDRVSVERDYLASNAFRHTTANDPLNGVNIAWLRASFATADKVYGSFDNYVRAGLGLTAADVASLKKSLLVQPGDYGWTAYTPLTGRR